MKDFYGNCSIVMNMNFIISANSLEEAEEIVRNANFDFKLVKEDTREEIETDIQGWHMVDECGIGNVREPDLEDFFIEEES